MIKGKCLTNLDDYDFVEWPTEFVAVPKIGDRVENDSFENDRRGILKVVRITHCYNWKSKKAFIKIELNK